MAFITIFPILSNKKFLPQSRQDQINHCKDLISQSGYAKNKGEITDNEVISIAYLAIKE